jgi:hypothetical protein
VTGCIGGVMLGLVALMDATSPPLAKPAAAAAAPAPASPPAHYYVARIGSYFGYPASLSDDDRARGLATKPLTLVSYQGKHNGEYDFTMGDGGAYADAVSCTEPCEFVRSMGMGGLRIIPAQPGSIVWAVLEDIRHGELDAARTLDPKMR